MRLRAGVDLLGGRAHRHHRVTSALRNPVVRADTSHLAITSDQVPLWQPLAVIAEKLDAAARALFHAGDPRGAAAKQTEADSARAKCDDVKELYNAVYNARATAKHMLLKTVANKRVSASRCHIFVLSSQSSSVRSFFNAALDGSDRSFPCLLSAVRGRESVAGAAERVQRSLEALRRACEGSQAEEAIFCDGLVSYVGCLCQHYVCDGRHGCLVCDRCISCDDYDGCAFLDYGHESSRV